MVLAKKYKFDEQNYKSQERFAKTRSLHPSDAVQGFGISQQAFCNAKWSLYIRRHCLPLL